MSRALLLAVVVLVLAAAPAAAVDVVGYGGGSPFRCDLQQAGLGTEVPDPDADPLCVEYDKTEQNVDRLGIVPFLLGEPARFALAGDKCFYLQHDHWRSSVQQDFEQSEIYNWDGWYFLDRARGVGGSYVENFTLNNASADPRALPGFPERYRPFFSYGRGGLQITDSVPIDPRCVEKARRDDVYAPPAGSSAPTAEQRRALAPPRPRLALRLTARRGRDRAGRRCARGGVRARVQGRDARHVRSVAFRVRGRTVTLDTRAPFSRRIERRHLRRSGLTRLGARVRMRDGHVATLGRRVRRCP